MKGCFYAAALFAGVVFLLGAVGGAVSWWWAFWAGGLMCLGWQGLTGLENPHSDEIPSVPPDSETTDYCAGCGCNHLRRWMTFDDDGQYRCRVCCEDGPVFVDRNVH